MERKVITKAPLSPSEAHKDQLKIKRESGQSSGDESPKKWVERITYYSSHVSFQWKIEGEILKPFRNKRAKIRGQILFKRRGMMRSEVLNNVWGHGESQRNELLAKDRGLGNLMDSVDKIPRFQSTDLSRNLASQLRGPRYHRLVFCFIFGLLLIFLFGF